MFMGKVHDKLAYDALDTVEKNLNERIVQHNEKVKVLVKENLDRFGKEFFWWLLILDSSWSEGYFR